MKRLTLFLLCLCFVFITCSCGGEQSGVPSSSGEVKKGTPFAITEAYTVIRDTGNDSSVQAATSLFKRIRGELDIKLTSSDTSAPETECEILIGNTGRAESASAKKELRESGGSHDSDYIIKIDGKKAVIVSFKDEMLSNAVNEFFEKAVAGKLASGDTLINIENKESRITLNGVSISDWNFVLPRYNASYYAVRKLEELENAISSASGQHINIVRDNEPEWEYEVVVGDTAREGSLKPDKEDYAIKVTDRKIYIGGGENYSLAYGIEQFAKFFGEKDTSVTDLDGKYVNGENGDDYRLVFADEFDTLNKDIWLIHDQNHGNADRVDGKGYGSWFGMNTARSARNVFCENGNLHLHASYDDDTYYGAWMDTQTTLQYTYGFSEISARLADGDGIWHDFWIISADSLYHNEFDVVECPGPGDYFVTNVHERVVANGKFDHSNNNVDISYVMRDDTYRLNDHVYSNFLNGYVKYDPARSLNNEYHTYACEWTESCINMYLDGKEMLHYEYLGTEAEKNYKGASYIILSMLVGANYDNITDPSALKPTSWRRWPDKTADFWNTDKADFIIDYLRIFQKPGQTLKFL